VTRNNTNLVNIRGRFWSTRFCVGQVYILYLSLFIITCKWNNADSALVVFPIRLIPVELPDYTSCKQMGLVFNQLGVSCVSINYRPKCFTVLRP